MVPRHIRNIAIAVLLVLLALAAAINSYIHYQFKSNIDHALDSVRAFAHIEYDELSTSLLSAEVNLKNIRISSPLLPEKIILGDVNFETPGFLYMLSGASSIKQNELPNHFAFTLSNFYFDLSSETAILLDNITKQMQPIYADERKICAGKAIFSPKDYKEMGYNRLLSKLHLSYDFNENDKSINLKVRVNTQNMAEVKADIKLTDINNASSIKQLPKLSQLNITYKDKTYTPRMLKYCAALDKIKKEEFINAEVSQSDEYFYMLLGFAPGKGLREAYKDFLSKPDVVTLSMSPSKNFNPKIVPSLSSEELIKNLNVRLNINGLPVNDLSYTTPSEEFIARFEQQVAKKLNLESLLRGEPINTPKAIAKSSPSKKVPAAYYKIALADVKQFVGGFVQIQTKTGSERNGQLIRMDEVNLYIEQKVSGGKFTMTVPKTKIASIKAYFSKPIVKEVNNEASGK